VGPPLAQLDTSSGEIDLRSLVFRTGSTGKPRRHQVPTGEILVGTASYGRHAPHDPQQCTWETHNQGVKRARYGPKFPSYGLFLGLFILERAYDQDSCARLQYLHDFRGNFRDPTTHHRSRDFWRSHQVNTKAHHRSRDF
jgi:hypothetical protein